MSTFDFNLIKKAENKFERNFDWNDKITECIDEKSNDDLNDVFKKTAHY